MAARLAEQLGVEQACANQDRQIEDARSRLRGDRSATGQDRRSRRVERMLAEFDRWLADEFRSTSS